MVNIQGVEEQYLEITLRYFSISKQNSVFFTEVFVSFLQRVLTQCCGKIELKQTCNSIVFKSRILEKKFEEKKIDCKLNDHSISGIHSNFEKLLFFIAFSGQMKMKFEKQKHGFSSEQA